MCSKKEKEKRMRKEDKTQGKVFKKGVANVLGGRKWFQPVWKEYSSVTQSMIQLSLMFSVAVEGAFRSLEKTDRVGLTMETQHSPIKVPLQLLEKQPGNQIIVNMLPCFELCQRYITLPECLQLTMKQKTLSCCKSYYCKRILNRFSLIDWLLMIHLENMKYVPDKRKLVGNLNNSITRVFHEASFTQSNCYL